MIEFFFDCSSPWTYLAFHNIQPLARELDAPIVWRPILVGGIFNAVNPGVYENRANPVPAKADYLMKDVADWARHAGLPIRFPPTVFPVNSVKAMRGCLWLQHQHPQRDSAAMLPFARAVFEAYWGRDEDIARDDVLAAICGGLGIDAPAFFAGIADPAIKHELRANADELMARNGFGSPTFFVGGTDLYFGNDRLPLLAGAVRRARDAGR